MHLSELCHSHFTLKISESNCAKLLKENEYLKRIAFGISEVDSGKGISHNEAKLKLQFSSKLLIFSIFIVILVNYSIIKELFKREYYEIFYIHYFY